MAGNLNNSIKEQLDYWYEKICTRDFIALDPVQFVHNYNKREDIEIAAFLTAAIAWGRRDMILRSAKKMFALMGSSPYDYVMSGGFKKLRNKNIHRTFFENDFKYYCLGLNRCYAKFSSLEKMFAAALAAPASSAGKPAHCFSCASSDVWQAFAFFREEMAAANKGGYSRHVSNPGLVNRNGSACKKLNLTLRWLVREGPVDSGIWKKIKTDALYIPLDVHVARTARQLGLLQRKSNDKKAVIELTEKLRGFCPEDPVKYDFALFGMN